MEFTAALMALAGGGSAVFGVVQGVRSVKLMRSGSRTSGEVIGLVEHKGRPGGEAWESVSTFAPTIQFVDRGGQAHEFEGAGREAGAWAVGKTVKVVYDPERPEEASIATATELFFAPVLMVPLGIIFLFIGLQMAFRGS